MQYQSVPRKILPYSAGQLAKFHGSRRQNCPKFHGSPRPPIYDWKLRQLFRNFSYWRLALY